MMAHFLNNFFQHRGSSELLVAAKGPGAAKWRARGSARSAQVAMANRATDDAAGYAPSAWLCLELQVAALGSDSSRDYRGAML
jgi:hypothetical protein